MNSPISNPCDFERAHLQLLGLSPEDCYTRLSVSMEINMPPRVELTRVTNCKDMNRVVDLYETSQFEFVNGELCRVEEPHEHL